MHHQNPYFVFITDRSGRPFLSYKSGLLLGFLILLCWAGSAQVVQDSTDFSTEVIQVVKSYAPEISDAFKMKQLPDFDEGPSASEIKLTYALLSVPVATDFVINLPNALPFKSVSGEKPFDYYARIWGGTKESLGLDVYGKVVNTKDKLWSFGLQHQQVNGSLPGINLANDWSLSEFSSDLRLMNQDREVAISVDLSQRKNMFYGWSPAALASDGALDVDLAQAVTQGIVKAKIGPNGSWFDGGTTTISYLRDRFESTEFSVTARPQGHLLIGAKPLNIKAQFNVLQTTYPEQAGNLVDTEYRIMNHDLEGDYAFEFNQFLLRVGAQAWYHHANTDDAQLSIFPKLYLAYPIIKDVMRLEGTYGGAYEQQTYGILQNANNWVAPHAVLRPTVHEQFLDVTLSGAWTKQIHYHVGARWDQIKDQPLWVRSDYALGLDKEPYDFGNAFEVVYDQVSALKLHYGFSADIDDQWQMGVRGSIVRYEMDRASEPWNLPQSTMAFDAHYRYSPKWSLSTQFLAYGPRKDRYMDLGDEVTTQVKGFVDLGATLRHQITRQWMANITVNNALNQEYELWVQYPVQGFRVNLGLQYNFDLP